MISCWSETFCFCHLKLQLLEYLLAAAYLLEIYIFQHFSFCFVYIENVTLDRILLIFINYVLFIIADTAVNDATFEYCEMTQYTKLFADLLTEICSINPKSKLDYYVIANMKWEMRPS